MENSNKRYWKGIEEFTNDLEFVQNAENEFPKYLPQQDQQDPNEEGNKRRDFLKLMGFSIAAASLAACEAPVKYAIPYLNKPLDVDPSVPNFYASTFFKDGEYSSILVKTREGRPIKIEGNEMSAISKGKTSARVQASVLDLYDETRFKGFLKKGATLPESKKQIALQNQTIDEEIISKLAGKRIRIVSPTIISPSLKAAIKEFTDKHPSARHIVYDAASAEGILKANKATFGKEMLPTYDFSKADVIVSFAADFLGTWISPVEFAGQYAKNRKLGEKSDKKMSRHFQFESRMSPTGANADYRFPVKVSEEALLVAALYDKLNGGADYKDKKIAQAIDKVAKALNASKGKSLVVSGSKDPDVQVLVNAINQKLGNYGQTILTDLPTYTHQGNDTDINQFIDDVKNSRVDVAIFFGTNPVYTHPRGAELKASLKNVATKISLASHPDETTAECDYICPDNHYLESWSDAEPRMGHFSLGQPAITNIFDTRQALESFLVWTGNRTSAYDYIRNYWASNLLSRSGTSDFVTFWNNALYNGVATLKVATTAPAPEGEPEAEPTAAPQPGSSLSKVKDTYGAAKGIELATYQKVGLGVGSQANNPWLQEMPDPITKACWGNYLCVSQSYAEAEGLEQGDVVEVSAGKQKFKAPVLVQPGQAPGTVSIALGYGRTVTGKVGQEVGVDVAPLAGNEFVGNVSISKTGEKDRIAQTQTHHTIMGRDIIQEASFNEYKEDALAGRHIHQIYTAEGYKKPTDITLWKGHDYPNHSWGLVVDLTSCIGCSACTIACQSENNVPVVGKKEVLMRREMHWIRIDRYYSSDAEEGEGYAAMEKAAENPQVTFMPMMCQHCNNAPCETVCPVLATTHSTEGLNQMTYNRCIGTRYCANNCPYKVRRFNWFHYAEDTRFTEVNYQQTTDLGKMVLNPDVTVRSRGVMEKCSMCVQRIQSAKLDAKKEKRKIKDGEFTVACAQACPTDALIFGDMNNLDSQISQAIGLTEEVIEGEHGAKDKKVQKITEPRAYHVLEEINVKPQVSYLTKIRNIDEKMVHHDAGHGGNEHSEEGEAEAESHS